MDVSLASTAACVVTGQGKFVKEAQILSEPDALIRFLHELAQSLVSVGLEAGPLSQWLHKGLTGAGFETVLMETRQVKGALKAMPIKPDRRDAEGIARPLQIGWLRPVHCKSVSSKETRALLENYFLPGDLEAQIEAFLDHYNHQRYRESPNNVKPSDVYFARAQAIINKRERIKHKNRLKRHACNTANSPQNQTNQMSQILA